MSTSPAATPAIFRVFNQGGRKFVYHELELKPNQFTTVPPQHIEGVKKLLTKWPTELTSAETADAHGRATNDRITALITRAEKAEADVKLLQNNLLEKQKDLTARAESAESKLKDAVQTIRVTTDRMNSLEQQLASASDQLKSAQGDIDRLTRPPA